MSHLQRKLTDLNGINDTFKAALRFPFKQCDKWPCGMIKDTLKMKPDIIIAQLWTVSSIKH